MLDPQTMRIALGGVSLTVLVLFYVGVYRPTRSSFSGWWSVSLLCAGSSTSLLLFNGTDLQVIANPASVLLSALGTTCVWFATRSLRRRELPRWALAVGPPAILVPTLLQNPAENIWAGNGPLFVYMGVAFAAAATEVWLVWAMRRGRLDGASNPETVVALVVSAMAASALGLYYLFRGFMYYAVGPESDAFESLVGTSATTGILLVCLVAVTFSVSAIGWDQRTHEFRQRAMKDDLTGLLGRTEFRLQADSAVKDARARGMTLALVIADLDHFKEVNDGYGHAAGDRTLMAFARAVSDALKPGELAGRLGGEEFGLVLLDVDDATALARLEAISAEFAALSDHADFPMPTVSYGIAGLDDGDTMAQVFEHADMALYQAKDDGRDRAVKYTDEVGQQAGRALGRRASDRDASAQEPPG